MGPLKVPSGGKIKTFPVRELGLLERCRRRALYDSLHPASRQVSLDVTMAHKAGSDLTSSRGIACSLRKCSGHSRIDPSQGLHQKATCNNGLLPRWGTRLLVATVAAVMGGPEVTSNQVCGGRHNTLGSGNTVMIMKPTGIGGPRIYNTGFETREKHRCKERFKTCQRGLTRANNFKPEIQLLASTRMTDPHKQVRRLCS